MIDKPPVMLPEIISGGFFMSANPFKQRLVYNSKIKTNVLQITSRVNKLTSTI